MKPLKLEFWVISAYITILNYVILLLHLEFPWVLNTILKNFIHFIDIKIGQDRTENDFDSTVQF